MQAGPICRRRSNSSAIGLVESVSIITYRDFGARLASQRPDTGRVIIGRRDARSLTRDS